MGRKKTGLATASAKTRGQLQQKQQTLDTLAKLFYVVGSMGLVSATAGAARLLPEILPESSITQALELLPSSSNHARNVLLYPVVLSIPVYLYAAYRYDSNPLRPPNTTAALVEALFADEITADELPGLLRIIIHSAVQHINIENFQFDIRHFLTTLRNEIKSSQEYKHKTMRPEPDTQAVLKLMQDFLHYKAKTTDFRDPKLMENEAQIYLKYLKDHAMDPTLIRSINRDLFMMACGFICVFFFSNSLMRPLYNAIDVFNAFNIGRSLLLVSWLSLNYQVKRFRMIFKDHDPERLQSGLNMLTQFMKKQSTWETLTIHRRWESDAMASFTFGYTPRCDFYISTENWGSSTIKSPVDQSSVKFNIPQRVCNLLLADFLMKAGYRIVSADNHEVLVVSTEHTIRDDRQLQALSQQLFEVYQTISMIYSLNDSFSQLKKHFSNPIEKFNSAIYFRHGYPPKIFLHFTFDFRPGSKIECVAFTSQIELLLADYNLRIKAVHEHDHFTLIIDDLLALYQRAPDFNEVISNLRGILREFDAGLQSKHQSYLAAQPVSTARSSVINNNNFLTQKAEHPTQRPQQFFTSAPQPGKNRFFIKDRKDKLPSELAEQVTLKLADDRVFKIKRTNFHKVRDKDNEYICIDTSAKGISRLKDKNKDLYTAYKEYLRRGEGPAYASTALGSNGILSMKNGMKKLKLCNTDDRPHGEHIKQVTAIFEDKTELVINITILTECKTHQQLNRR